MQLLGLARAFRLSGAGFLAGLQETSRLRERQLRAAGEPVRHHQRQKRPVLRGLRLLLPVGVGPDRASRPIPCSPKNNWWRPPGPRRPTARSRFSLVTSGRGLASSEDRDALVAGVAAIREAVDINICASLGIADRGFLAELKAAGLKRFHHNLEAAPSFFPDICTTHTFQDRVATIEAAKAAGLEVCVGGIVGLGETLAQRAELAQAIGELDPDAIPLISCILSPAPGWRTGPNCHPWRL